jgi:hypothetical protein
MITRLGRAERNRVWRALDPPWLHYAWSDGHWRCYPVDPRTSPMVQSAAAARQFHEGEPVVERSTGFEEAP